MSIQSRISYGLFLETPMVLTSSARRSNAIKPGPARTTGASLNTLSPGTAQTPHALFILLYSQGLCTVPRHDCDRPNASPDKYGDYLTSGDAGETR